MKLLATPILVICTIVLASCGGETTVEQASLPNQPVAPLADDGRYFGYIRIATAEPPTISFDVAQAFWGEAANRAAAEDGVVGPGEPVSNDHYERNPDSRTQALTLATDVQVTASWPVTRVSAPPEALARCPSDCSHGIPVGLADFFASFEERPDRLSAVGGPFWVTLRDDLVVAIDEQYFP